MDGKSRYMRLVALATVGLMVLAPFLGAPGSAEGYDTFFLNDFKTGDHRSVLSFAEGGKLTTGMEMDPLSVIFNATVNATSDEYTPSGLDYPLNPYIDIGADGVIDWQFSGLGYGRWGLQDVFNDGSSMINLTFEANDTREVRFKLPKGADIKGGGFTTGGWPVPYWGPEYVVSSTQTESKGEFGPDLEIFKDRMYEAWESNDPTITTDSDFDIVYRWFDGENWSQTKEISPPGDFLQDDSPSLIVYKDKLYCAWSASESDDFFSNDDIYLRWTEDGDNWSPLKKVSPILRAGMNDWPVLEIYQDRLYIFWKTMDDSIANVENSNDMDIVYRWYDGTNFGPIEEITKGDDGAIDWSYDVAVYNNRLYVVWETDVGDWLEYQVDVMVKSYDGASWSNRKNLCPSNDDTKDEIPRTYVWFNPVKKIEELYVIWGRGDGNQYGTGDIDIVIRVFDGTKWSPIQEISQPNVQVQNMGHRLIGYQGRLYATWIDGKESVVVGGNDNLVVFKIFGDIVIRSFDGWEWSKIKELTPSGQSDKASDPELCVFKGKLYATWSFPNDQTSSSDDWDIIIRNIDFQDVTLDVDIGKDGTIDWSGELTSSQHVIPLNRSQIEAALTGGSIVDDYDNEITEVAIRIKSKFPSKLRVHDLKIEYEYKIPFDFAEQLDSLLARNRPAANDSRQSPQIVEFPIEAGTESSGKIIFEDLEVEYLINYRPFLIREIPVLYMEEDTDWENAVDLEEYFSDDWDDGDLMFRIASEEDESLLDAYIRSGWIGFRTPTENWYGISNVSVIATDGFGLDSIPYTIQIQVLPINDPPVLDFIPDQRLRVGDKFKYQASAFDVDGDKLIFKDSSKVFNINKDSGTISFIPSSRGKFKVNVSVADGFGGEDWQNMTFIIEGENTSSAESSCFSLLAIVLLAVGISLVAWKLRHEAKWGPVAPERLKIPTEDDEEDEATKAPTKGVGRRRKKGRPSKGKGRPGARKKKMVIPGTSTTYDHYDSNRDGFLDDQEWEVAVKDIKRQRDQRRAKLKARARALAKKRLEMEKAREEPPVQDMEEMPPAPEPEDKKDYEWKLGHEEEYLPPGLRTKNR